MSVIGRMTEQRARKAHVCSLCGFTIRPDSRYLRWVWKDMDTLGTIKAHRGCEDLRREVDLSEWTDHAPLIEEARSSFVKGEYPLRGPWAVDEEAVSAFLASLDEEQRQDLEPLFEMLRRECAEDSLADMES